MEELGFHPLIERWFKDRFRAPTAPQTAGWPSIRAGQDTLIAAPTGSGKTLTAFLVCLDQLFRQAVSGTLADKTQVLYISPLKALSNDVRKNLEVPLAELSAMAREQGLPMVPIRALVRTGDTTAKDRQAMLRKPPHIVVTTPESLYLVLTSDRGRNLLKSVRTVIVDEIHALARDKRGSHLALSLERLEALCDQPPLRIGLSATQKPIDEIAAFLVGTRRCDSKGAARCAVIDTGHQRRLDLGIEVPPSPLAAVCSGVQWEEVYARIRELTASHRSTLIFVNTRKLAERVAFNLTQHLGAPAVASHHGSLSKERRLDAEERLKSGALKAIVATASLELGIDVGYIDLVIQIGAPRSIATFLQRVGRAGHAVGALPKGRLFALTRDELLESMALVRAVRQGALDRIAIPEKPLDILAQQIVAEASSREVSESELLAMVRNAYPYRAVTAVEFEAVLSMLANGFAAGRRQKAYLHRDRVHGLVRARQGARLTALMSGGAIPEQGDYRVLTEGDQTFVGTVNEDFAIESSQGDIFLLGNTSWQVVQVKTAEVVVRDAHGAPPTIPFWLGEAPGRTIELSTHLSQLRGAIGARVEVGPAATAELAELEDIEGLKGTEPDPYRAAMTWLAGEAGAAPWPALQAVHYVAVEKAALGLVPSQEKIVFERFFDDSGGMQLVIHAPFGMRINRGWGLALRKRFCRRFDFELQASADNDGIVLSLGPQNSFPVEQLFGMLNEENIVPLLEQALLAVPLFQVRWRWNTTRALAVLRSRNGRRVPPALQRFQADDLMTAVFPAQTQCQENVVGDIPIPDHPLVFQTMHDCLHEAIDLGGLVGLLGRIKRGEVELIAKDTREPSPFAHQLLNAAPYAFLDDAPLEERRARAVATRRTLGIESMADLTRLSPQAIAIVSAEAWPEARSPDELHDVLEFAGVLPAGDGRRESHWLSWFEDLRAAHRAVEWTNAAGAAFWVATESLDVVRKAYGTAGTATPDVALPAHLCYEITEEEARLRIILGYMEMRAVVTAARIAHDLSMELAIVEATLPAIEARGDVIRGRFSGAEQLEWCHRRLLARIHRLTLDSLRRQIKPVSVPDYMRFLLHLHGIAGNAREGQRGLADTIEQLAGYEVAAGAWESEILPVRVRDYEPRWLDELTSTGAVTWGRFKPPQRLEDDGPITVGMSRSAPLTFFPRAEMGWMLPPERAAPLNLARPNASATYAQLVQHGAQFFSDLVARTGLLSSHLDEALGELARLGLAHADSFAAIRPALVRAKSKSLRHRPQRPGRESTYGRGGRWAAFPRSSGGPSGPSAGDSVSRVESWARLLLQRYGVVFWALLKREASAPPWRELVAAFRLMELRGEVRGGRFVAGPWGEQYALPEAVERLRQIRDQGGLSPGEKPSWVVLSAADPLNLFGVVTDDARLSSARQATMVVQDGVLVATSDGDAVTFHVTVLPELERDMRQALRWGGRLRAQRSHR